MQRSSRAAACLVMLAGFATACSNKESTGPSKSIDISLSRSSLTIPCGGSASLTASLTRGGGFTGSVSVSVTGHPDGVAVSLTPSQLTGNATQATIALTVDEATLEGTYEITVTASSSIGQAKATYTLIIMEAPGFDLSLDPAALTVNAGKSGTATVNITREGGFATPVLLTTTAKPADVTVTFLPASVAGASATMTVAVAGTVAQGTYDIVVEASAPSMPSRSATLSLTVTIAPAFTLSIDPATLSIERGLTGQATVHISRQGGFTGAVALDYLPPVQGLTIAFNPPNPTGATSTMTVTIAPSVQPGEYHDISVWGTAAGIDNYGLLFSVTVTQAPDVTLGIYPWQVSIEQGSTGTTNVNIGHEGGFTGEVTLTLVSPPPGISATFNPPKTTGATSVMTITVAASVAPEKYTLMVNATAQGVEDSGATMELTVTERPPGIVLDLTPAARTIQQWSSGTTDLQIARTNFTQSVTLSSSDAPAGMHVSFNPAATTGDASTVTIDVDLSVPVGTYHVTISGSGSGIATATHMLDVTVTEAPGEDVEYQFCNPGGVPVFFAIQDGTGPWRAVQATLSGSVVKFKFPITSSFAAITYITQHAAPTQASSARLARLGVFRAAFLAERSQKLASRASAAVAAGNLYESYYGFGTVEELVRDGLDWCTQTGPVGTYTGSVTGLAAGDNARIAIGDDFAGVSGATGGTQSYEIEEGLLGTKDLFASRRPGGGLVDRYAVLRDLVRPAGGALPLLDFNGPNAGAALPATLYVSNTLGDYVADEMFFQTSNGKTGNFTAPSAWGTGTTRPFGLVPPALTRASDVMGLQVRTSIGLPDPEDDIRNVVLGLPPNQNVVNLTFGPRAPAPVISAVTGVPYLRLRAQGSLPAQYPDFVLVQLEPYNGGAYGGNYVALAVTKGYLQATGAGAGYDVTMPDLSSVAGFPVASALPHGQLYIFAGASSVTGGINQSPYQPLRIGMRVDWARTVRFQSF